MPLRAVRKALAVLLFAAATAAGAQLTLAADTSAAPYHSVVHLTASGAAGSVVFLDGQIPIATVPAGQNGLAVLGTATLTPGPHTFTAQSTAALSNSVQVTIAKAPAPFQISTDTPTLFQSAALSLVLLGLPPKATGALTYLRDGVPFATATLTPNTPLPTYQAFGDSITSGFTLAHEADRYPNLFASARGFIYYGNYALTAALGCDVLANQLLPNHLGPTQDVSPLYSVMIGSTDMDKFGVLVGEPNYTTCHQAALAWLAIPREFKILPGDPAATILSGPWSLPPVKFDSTSGTLFNSSGAGAAQFAVTSTGGPVYLWYLLGDKLTGTFTVTLDGTPTGTTYSTNPASPIGSQNNPDSTGFALLRFPVDAGPHTLRVDIVSGSVGLLAAATPPSPGAASVHPTVLASDVPNQNLTQAYATPATIAQYSADALADINLLAQDGLDIRPVPTHNFLGTSAAEFFDFAHPSVLGHQHLLAAFQAAFSPAAAATYLSNSPTFPRQYPIADAVGTHTYTANYSGDAIYAPSTASTTVTVVAAGHSVTTLSSARDVYYAAEPVTASATLFPATPGAVLSLMEGPQVLATAAAPASFTLPTLTPGYHTLYAAYAGDKSAAASTSPPLTFLILKNAPNLVLTGVPATATYAAPITLTAHATPASATGNVTFTDTYTPSGQTGSQTQTLGQPPLISGLATLTLGTLAPGTHSFALSYLGDSNNSPATSLPLVTVIATIPTATTLFANPSSYGQPTTFTAQVTPPNATGSITFTDLAANTIAQAALANGSATWTSTNLTPGTHNVLASYAGDPTHAPSTSTQVTAVIPHDPSTITLAASATTLAAGDPVTLTASLSPAAATGTILFSDPTAGTLGQPTVFSGTATLTLPALPPGTYRITANYAGDPNTLPSTSAPLAIQILNRTSSTTLTAATTAPYATAVLFTAVISPAGTNGLLRFSENGTALGTSPLQNSSATFTTSTLSPGPHTLTATFAGNPTLDPSSGSTTITITQATSATTLTLAQPSVLAGSPTIANIRIATTSDTPTGTVILRSGPAILASGPVANAIPGAAYATLSFPTSAVGTFPLTASYSGDTGTTASDSAATSYTVLPRIATGVLTLSATQVPPQTPVILSAAFTTPATSGPALVPTGSVAFSRGTTLIANVPLDPSGLATTSLPAEAIGAYTLTAVYTPTGVFTASPVPAQILTVTQPLAIAFTTPTMPLSPGGTADTTAAYTPLSGFQGAVATQCTTDAAFLTCTAEAPTTLSTAATAHIHLTVARSISSTTALKIIACLLPFCFLARRRLTPLLVLLVAVTLNGCATGGTFNNVPPGTHLITLTATAVNTPTTATLTVVLN